MGLWSLLCSSHFDLNIGHWDPSISKSAPDYGEQYHWESVGHFVAVMSTFYFHCSLMLSCEVLFFHQASVVASGMNPMNP